ncbi:MAG: hypothetical protein JNN15_00695, partial [Blastocatellia bacterium]|nr:hypothetical protein [Blastocatellia bacterium]
RFRVEKVLSEASQLNSFVRKNNVSSEIRKSWNNLRHDLNLLADLYNLRRLR